MKKGTGRQNDPRLQAQRHHLVRSAEHAGWQGYRDLHAALATSRLPAVSQIDRPAAPAGLDLHLIVDNHATYKTPAVKRWLKAHPHFHLHFTPTSASWLNMVERFFAEIARKRIRRGTFMSVAELKSAIMEYQENHNVDPKPFIRTKSAGQILEKVTWAKQVLESQR
jgi:hypothetical protein